MKINPFDISLSDVNTKQRAAVFGKNGQHYLDTVTIRKNKLKKINNSTSCKLQPTRPQFVKT